eukprot:114295-Rhodomonas_salina.1
MKSEGFIQSGFKDSVWIQQPDEWLPRAILMSAHIDDTLILCKDLDTLSKFKALKLTRFEGTDEGDVTEYLGCEVVRDQEQRTLHLRQSAYIKKVLAIHAMTDANPVKTPMEPGVSLSKWDSPAVVDVAIQTEYSAIVGHISFMVMMTRPDLAFAFAELSKLVQNPGVEPLRSTHG